MGLPPTASKISTDTSNVTTFFFQFPNFTGTHTGATLALGVNSVAGGGTGLATLTANNVILGNGTSNPIFVAPGTTGNILSSNGTTWLSTTPVGNSAFAIFTSSLVNTDSSSITSATFVTFSNSPAFTFSPTISGTYKVYCAIPVDTAGTNAVTVCRVFNTSGGATLLAESQSASSAANTLSTLEDAYIQSTYTLVAGTSYQFDIQGKTNGTSTIAGSNAQFYMFAEGVGLAVPSQTSGVAASYYLSTNTAFTAGNPIIFDTQLFDTSSAYNTSTGTYTIPTSGFYEITCGAVTTSGTSGIYVSHNGVAGPYISIAGSGTASNGGTTLSCIAGDTIQLLIDTSRTIVGTGAPYESSFSIVLVPNPAAGGSGVTTMTAFGSSPNANAATISGVNLTLQPASASFPGGVSTTSQTFAGSKNFTSPIGYNNTTPAAATALDIINTTGATQRIVQTGYAGSVGMRGRYANGSLGTPTAAVAGNILSFISGMGYGASQFPASSTGAINIVANETFTNTSNQTYLQFNTTPTGSVTTAEAARVATTGVTLGPQSASTALHQVNGGLQLTTTTITASTYTIDNTTTDNIVYTDSTSNAIAITLPAPVNGRKLYIIDKTGKAGTNNVTIVRHGTETINGIAASFVVAQNYASLLVTTDGTNWTIGLPPTSGNSFLTAGTTYTTPVNITPQTRFKFTLIGGGGGAGGINTAADGAAGGGAGAAVIVQATGLSANTGYTIAIGGGGTAGAATPTAGGNGGVTTINFLGSTYTAGGGTGANDTATSNGGAGGTATSTAGTGVSTIINMPGGGGGAASGVTTNGSGQGGSGFMGWGGISVIAAGAGNNGTGFGGGGSGGKGAAAAGGAGAGGCIVVEWWN